jgi:hypothetical protein
VRPVPAPVAATNAFRWASLESADYRIYIANLRAFGCPADVIRDLIVADINKLYEPREAPLRPAVSATLVTGVAGRQARAADYERRQRLHEIQREKNALLQELLGIQLPLESLGGLRARDYAQFEAAFAALPPDQRERVRRIQEEYWLASDALADGRGPKVASPRLESVRLNQQRLTQLATVLPAGELENFEMRTSALGAHLRATLDEFKPSQAEFQQIFRVRREFDDAPGNATEERRRQLDERLRQTLGEQRFADYRKSQDETLRHLTQLTTRFGLPADAATRARTVARDFEEAGRQLEGGRVNPTEEWLRAFEMLKEERQRALVQVLGERAFQAWQRAGQSLGSW